ncbi:hypothetical protein KKC13_05100 [bacterium]|nr:hypothetical protein [bacterium]MBU1959404.1 hypothetical protein [bacterium]
MKNFTNILWCTFCISTINLIISYIYK